MKQQPLLTIDLSGQAEYDYAPQLKARDGTGSERRRLGRYRILREAVDLVTHGRRLVLERVGGPRSGECFLTSEAHFAGAFLPADGPAASGG